MLPLLVLRPEPGNTATCNAARALGLEPVSAPLFRYAACDWQVPDTEPWQGLLIGSAAVITHGGPALDALHAVPVHAVGPATARAAQNNGFTIAATGSGGLQVLVASLPPGRYLRLAGEAHVPLTPPRGVTIDDAIVYAAQPQPLDPATIAHLRHARVVALLHSGEAARQFAEQCALHGLPRNTIALVALAPRIAQAAGSGWADIHTAHKTDDDALLSLAKQMCQTL